MVRIPFADPSPNPDERCGGRTPTELFPKADYGDRKPVAKDMPMKSEPVHEEEREPNNFPGVACRFPGKVFNIDQLLEPRSGYSALKF